MRWGRAALLALGLVAIAALAVACGEGAEAPSATPPARPEPVPVEVPEEPSGATLGDPAFEALPGAQAHFGRLGGTVYQIEMPDDWNGRLVLYMHGYRDFAPTLTVAPPSIRGYLIRNGYAWGASSYSNNGLIPGLAADETAALWDLFVQRFGRPERTYATGHSMGGGGTAISAERYAGRYDGALSLCGIAGSTPEITFVGDFSVAGTFAAGVTQADFDSTPIDELVDTRILPLLEDPAVRQRFEAIVIDLTGGPRPFDREGVRLRVLPNFDLIKQFSGASLYDNQETVYRLGPLSDVSSEEFNAAAIRLSSGDLLESFIAGHDISGDIQIPVLTLHTTGDFFVPMSAQQVLRRKVDAAGKGDLLVQRIVQDPAHCWFTNAEWETGLEDLIAWVERDEKPDGDDVLIDDLSEIGTKFTLAPRLGLPEAEAVPGADERVTVRGTLTLDGQPLDGLGPVVRVRGGGLERACNFMMFPVASGRYDVTVAGDGEARGCGAPGAEIYLSLFGEEDILFTQETAPWPTEGTELIFDASFSSADPEGVASPLTAFSGAVLGASGESLPPGTVIEAYVGETLCGVSSLQPVRMLSGDPESYTLFVAGPDAVPGCEAGADVSFLVDGESAEETAVHDLAGAGFDEIHLLDLTVPGT